MDRENQMPAQNQDRFREFTYRELAEATDFFNYEHILGDGGFGEVFWGKFGDRYVVIKKLIFTAAEEQEEREFQNRFRALGSIDHENLVKLIGYCCEGPNRLIVCEFCSNQSLRWHLCDEKTFPWNNRLKIAIGSAKGIQYLHENCRPKIIHRDIKPENIVLEPNFHAKVVDFGLAKCFPLIGNKTHISSLLKGTAVYADPEYGPNHQRVSEKSDVYSFGVVLLELVSRHKPETDGVTIIDWAKPRLRQALDPKQYNMEVLIDPNLEEKDEQGPRNEIKMMICCAAASVYKPSKKRPRMKQIVQALEMQISPNEIWKMDSDHVYLGPN